ncbi:PD40 domain-containing protein [bacterium]|nr:PD40 domain-containing protein [bacterium]
MQKTSFLVCCVLILLSINKLHADWDFEAVTIGSVSPEHSVFEIRYSNDGSDWIYSGMSMQGPVVVKDDDFYMVCNGVKEIALSPDGKHFGMVLEWDTLYSAIFKDDTIGFFGLDIPEYYFSPDLSHYAFVVLDESLYYFFLYDGQQIGTGYDEIKDVLMTGDLNYYTFTGEYYDPGLEYLLFGGDVVEVYINGVLYDEYEPYEVVLSGEGGHYGYYYMLESGNYGVIIDGKLVGEYSMIITPIAFSDNGKKWGFGAVDSENRNGVVFNGKFLPTNGQVVDFFISPDGKRYAYEYIDGGELHHIVLDGSEHFGIRYAYDEKFSPDSKDFGYIAAAINEKFIVVTGVTLSEGYDEVYFFQYSPNAIHTYYEIVEQESVYVPVIDGVKYPGYYFIRFSPDGKRVVMTRDYGPDSVAVVVDGKEEGLYSFIGQVFCYVEFSTDSRHYAYRAEQPDGGVVVVLDGKESPVYQAVSGLSFSGDSKYLFYVKDNRDIQRVEL